MRLYFSPTPPYVPEHKGNSGMAYCTPSHLAGYRCGKGHIPLCLENGLAAEVADGTEPHRSRTAVGARLFIVD